ncbi:acyl-CoA dehydrogenase family protein [Streptomyces johnsoniae]|uniref:Acyl-CoA dehydrogenase family protein n=1 Tax=Streptomyces johnsoniae TaxID=3075532 RepID=A0ABU2S471_9ACTN|nr:acyl-CoA dehydrogenase family protein [Streptomyces sp. DSM 41886]MDT0443777.1 acyl-CoA dehydrogenase family protein [Streptomyces sp. DSM 41886]
MRRLLDAGWATPSFLGELSQDPPPGEATAADRIRAIAATDYATLPVPAEFGGGGAGLVAVAGAQRALGRLDPGPAIALNMHSMTVGLMVDYWRRHRDTSWMLLESIAETHALVASAFAEPGGNGNFLSSRSVAVPEGKGFRISGTKYPCSLSTTATLMCVTAQVRDTDETLIALVPANSPGITHEGDWPSLGMRLSDTGRVRLTDVEIDRRLVFYRGPAGAVDDILIAGVVWFVVLVAATYHGVLSTLLDRTAEQCAGTTSRSRTALIGRAARELYALGAATRALAADWEHEALTGHTALAAAMGLRASLSDVRERFAGALTPVIGGRAYTEGHPAAAVLLDSLAVHHHPPSLLVCDDAVGAYCTGQPISFDPA